PTVTSMTTTLITGATKGIGLATARRLAELGHTVLLGARDLERGRRAAEEIGARAVQLDVTDEASVRAAADVVAGLGGLDVLVNNAGIEPRRADNSVPPAGETTGEDLLRVLDTNTIGPVRVLHAFLPLLQRSSAPVVVNVSSGLASLTTMSTPGSLASAYPGIAYRGLEGRGEHADRAVRQGVPADAHQRRRAGLHAHRPQRQHRHPDRRGGRRGRRPPGDDRPRRPHRHLPVEGRSPPLVTVSTHFC